MVVFQFIFFSFFVPLLRVLQYWMLGRLPNQFHQICWENTMKSFVSVILCRILSFVVQNLILLWRRWKIISSYWKTKQHDSSWRFYIQKIFATTNLKLLFEKCHTSSSKTFFRILFSDCAFISKKKVQENNYHRHYRYPKRKYRGGWALDFL